MIKPQSRSPHWIFLWNREKALSFFLGTPNTVLKAFGAHMKSGLIETKPQTAIKPQCSGRPKSRTRKKIITNRQSTENTLRKSFIFFVPKWGRLSKAKCEARAKGIAIQGLGIATAIRPPTTAWFIAVIFVFGLWWLKLGGLGCVFPQFQFPSYVGHTVR